MRFDWQPYWQYIPYKIDKVVGEVYIDGVLVHRTIPPTYLQPPEYTSAGKTIKIAFGDTSNSASFYLPSSIVFPELPKESPDTILPSFYPGYQLKWEPDRLHHCEMFILTKGQPERDIPCNGRYIPDEGVFELTEEHFRGLKPGDYLDIDLCRFNDTIFNLDNQKYGVHAYRMSSIAGRYVQQK